MRDFSAQRVRDGSGKGTDCSIIRVKPNWY